MTGIKDIFYDNKINGIIQGQPGMFQFMFTDKEQISTFREFLNCDLEFYSKLQNILLKKGIMIDETNAEPIFTSSAHTKNDLSKTLESLDSVISLVQKSKIKKSKTRF
jgi:glutamate-1-semialdehyde 2,1-aminomutase